uniref:beta strand repeat-containing protein n=1 Tax=Pleomorphomonas oryzae TaxID=261934 RepID=UPI00248038B5
MATITGTTGNDVLNGTTGDDQISGLDGRDTLIGGAGADVLNGGSGTDTASYADSSAAVNVDLTTGKGTGGDAEGDQLISIETVVGSRFNDTLTSNTSGQTLIGGAGDDVYIVGDYRVVVTEDVGGGIDEVRSASGFSIASYANVEKLTFTGSGSFIGIGNSGDNIITGGAGDDTLNGGGGADQLHGGGGNDTASYENATTGVSINLRTGVNTGEAAGDTYDSIERFLGSNYNDTFAGTAGGESFNGYGGIDTVDYSLSEAAVNVNLTTGAVSGGDAQGDSLTSIERVIGSKFNDTLSSSTSGQTLMGGTGDDVYIVGDYRVVVTEFANGGIDEVQSASGFSIASYDNVEKLTFTGTGSFIGIGNTGDNIITGGAGDDTLNGGGGADQLHGGGGNDTASYENATTGVSINLRTGVNTGEAAGDTYDSIERFLGSNYNDTFAGTAGGESFYGASGTDTVDYSLSEAAVNVNLTTGAVSGGDAQGDFLSSIERVIGSKFNDTLSSSTSGQTLWGGAGDDIYIVGNSGVVVTEGTNGGIDEVQTALTGLSIAGYTNVENLTYTGTGTNNFIGTGNAGDNIITGGAGNDDLTGGAGNDTLIGGAGSDTLRGGAGADHLIGGGGADVDIVSYSDAAVGVIIDLKNGANNAGDAAGDTYDGIEEFLGSNYNDTFVASAGVDFFIGSGGTDTVNYSTSSAAVNVTLSTGVTVGAGGDAQGDSLYTIERVVGSAYNDVLSTSVSGNTLQGGNGDDIYVVGNQGAIVTEFANGGTDEVQTTLTSFSIAGYTNVENLTYT